MTSESDAEFVKRMRERMDPASLKEDWGRLFALARRGAAVDDAHAVGFREGAAHMHKAQAARIERLEAALRDILDGFGLNPPHYIGVDLDADDLWIVNAARAALEDRT